jgi:hypothetical protein
VKPFVLSRQIEEVTARQIQAALPVKISDSHNPLAYWDIIENIRGRIENLLQMEIIRESYFLRKNESQMLCIFSIDTGENDRALAIAIRQSYDRTFSFGMAIGAHLFETNSLMFDVDAMFTASRNTRNILKSLRRKLPMRIKGGRVPYQKAVRSIDLLSKAPCNEEHGAQILGLAAYKGVLKPQQLSIAIKEWRDRTGNPKTTAYDLYLAMAVGIKSGDLRGFLVRHTLVHAFMIEQLFRHMWRGELYAEKQKL